MIICPQHKRNESTTRKRENIMSYVKEQQSMEKLGKSKVYGRQKRINNVIRSIKIVN